MPHHRVRRNLRLRGWDYAADGAYFITICTWNRAALFGEIVDGEMRLNNPGKIVADTWKWLGSQYPHVAIDEWCVMPDHLHGILVLSAGQGWETGGDANATAADCEPSMSGKSVGRLVGAFKTVSTKHVNRLRNTPGAVLWQRGFWDHVVRDQDGLERIRRYIRQNPAVWGASSGKPV